MGFPSVRPDARRSNQICVARMGPRVVPENSIRRDSRDEAESAHHPPRCLQLSNYLERISPICSSRDGGVKLRTCVYRKFHSAVRRSPAMLCNQSTPPLLSLQSALPAAKKSPFHFSVVEILQIQ